MLRTVPGSAEWRTDPVSSGIFRLHADLQPDPGARPLHAIRRASRSRSPNPENRQDVTVRAVWVRRAALALVAVTAIDLAGRQIARRSLLQSLPGPTPSTATV